MKAKKIHDILKPKSEEEILKAVEKINIASYKLSTFFTLKAAHKNDIFILKEICKKLEVSPNEMSISLLSSNEFVKNLLNKVLKETNTNIWKRNKSEYLFSHKYKIIKFGFMWGYRYYYVFPRKLNVNQLQRFIKELIKEFNI